MVTGIHGQKVKLGSLVRVLKIDPRITEYLAEKDKNDVLSMLDLHLRVTDMWSDHIQVEKEWDRGEGRIDSHSIPLRPNEFELISFK